MREVFFEIPDDFLETGRIMDGDLLNVPRVAGVDLCSLDGSDGDRDRTTGHERGDALLIRGAQMKNKGGAEPPPRARAVPVLFDEPDGDAGGVRIDVEEPSEHGEIRNPNSETRNMIECQINISVLENFSGLHRKST
jgi:hypothetical protein